MKITTYCLILLLISVFSSPAFAETRNWTCEGLYPSSISLENGRLKVRIQEIKSSDMSSYAEVKPLTGGTRFIVYFETNPQVQGREYALFLYRDQWTLRKEDKPGNFSHVLKEGPVEDLSNGNGVTFEMEKSLIAEDIYFCNTTYNSPNNQGRAKIVSPEKEKYEAQQKAAKEKIKEILFEIKAKTAAISDLTFTLEEDLISKDGEPYSHETSEIQMKMPSKRKKISKETQYGNKMLGRINYEREEIEIEDGHISWNVSIPKSIQKEIRNNVDNRIESAVMTFPGKGVGEIAFLNSGANLRSITYLGQENMDGHLCHVFQIGPKSKLWVSEKDGVVRKYIRESEGMSLGETAIVKNVRINTGLDDALFAYEPIEGAEIREILWDEEAVIDQELKENKGYSPKERIYFVPYQKAMLSSEKTQETRDKIKEVLDRYAGIEDFSAMYKHTNFPEHQVEYPANSGTLVSPTELTAGRRFGLEARMAGALSFAREN